jgi:hypothetical protein
MYERKVGKKTGIGDELRRAKFEWSFSDPLASQVCQPKIL